LSYRCLVHACLQGNTSSLGLDVMGIEANKRGLITVNDFYQTKVTSLHINMSTQHSL
jgi:pyruvate/2-oxoglutarate dehydrogenase complex dihydrolipoamide dehydrogenase (E3) component